MKSPQYFYLRQAQLNTIIAVELPLGKTCQKMDEMFEFQTQILVETRYKLDPLIGSTNWIYKLDLQTGARIFDSEDLRK